MMSYAWPTCRSLVGNIFNKNERMFEKVLFFTLKRSQNYEIVKNRPASMMYRRLHSGTRHIFPRMKTQYCCNNLKVQAVLKCAQVEANMTRITWNMQQMCCYCQEPKKPDDINKKETPIRDVLRLKREQLKEKEQQFRKTGQTILKDIKDTKDKMRERMEGVIERENIWTVPNVLCVGRIVASPYLGYLILQGDFQLALALFAFAGVTDLLDGWIARNFKNQSSKLGSFLDPMADKILVGVLFTTLTIAGHISVALTALIIARDLLLVGAGFYIRYQSLPPPRTLTRYFNATLVTAQLQPTLISKVNTVIQLLLVASVMAAPVWNIPSPEALLTLSYITAATTVASGLSYALKRRDTYHIFTKKKK